MSNICEEKMELPAEHERNVFGQFDEHAKKIEKTLGVTLISRDGQLKILGPKPACDQAVRILKEFLELSKRGNTITQQNVNYALSLTMEEKTSVMTEIDRDCICHTLNGRPIKPKTLGQKGICGCNPEENDCIWHRTSRNGKDLSGYGYGDYGF